MEDNVKFRKILGAKGESVGVSIPPECLDFLEAKAGDWVFMMPDEGKHGKFLAVWKVEQPVKVEER